MSKKTRLLKSWETSFEGFDELSGSNASSVGYNSHEQESHFSNTKGTNDGQENLLYGDRISNISLSLPGQDAGSPEQSQKKKMSVPESPDDIDVFLKEVLMHTADSAKATNRTTLPTNSPPRRRRKLSPPSSPISGERHRVLHSTPDSAGGVSSLIRRVLHPKRAHIQPTSVIETKEVCPSPELKGINADNPKLLTQVTQTQIIDVSIHDSPDSMKRQEDYSTKFPVSTDKLPSDTEETHQTGDAVPESQPSQDVNIARNVSSLPSHVQSQLISLSTAGFTSQAIQQTQFLASSSADTSLVEISQTDSSQPALSQSGAQAINDESFTVSQDNPTPSTSQPKSSLQTPDIMDKLSALIHSGDNTAVRSDCDPVKLKKIGPGGMAAQLQKIIQREESHYSVCRHQITMRSTANHRHADTENMISPSELRCIRLVMTETADDSDGLLHCVSLTDDDTLPQGTSVRLAASSLKKENYHRLHTDSEIMVYWPWVITDSRTLGTVLTTSSYCQVISGKVDGIRTPIKSHFSTTVTTIIGIKCCPCVSGDNCDNHPVYKGPHAFLLQ